MRFIYHILVYDINVYAHANGGDDGADDDDDDDIDHG